MVDKKGGNKESSKLGVESLGSQKENFTMKSDDRRRAVRNIIAGSGLTLGAATSGKWATPLVNSMILPAHAQTSNTTVLIGNASVSPLVTGIFHPEAEAGSVLDFFVGTANAGVVPSDPSLSGSCMTLTVTSPTSFTLVIEYASSGTASISGTISGSTLSGSGAGVTVSGTIDLTAATPTATGTVANSSGTFGFTIDSSQSSCSPIVSTTTTATPTSTTTTTATPTSTTTTTVAPTTTSTAPPAPD